MSSYISSACSWIARNCCCCCSSNSSNSTQQVYQIPTNAPQNVSVKANVRIEVNTAVNTNNYITAVRPQVASPNVSRSHSGKEKEYSVAVKLSPDQTTFFDDLSGDGLPGELIEKPPIGKNVAAIAADADDEFGRLSEMNVSPLGSPEHGRSEVASKAVSKAITPYHTSPDRSPSSSREKKLRITAVNQAPAPLTNSPVDKDPSVAPGSHPFAQDLPRIVKKRLSTIQQNKAFAMPASVSQVAQAPKKPVRSFVPAFGQPQVALRSGKNRKMLPSLVGAPIPAVAPIGVARPRPLGRQYSVSVTVKAEVDSENN
jgi:hypothetical protein